MILKMKKNYQLLTTNPQFNKGYTFIEVLIVLVLMGILGSALVGLQYILSQNQIVAWRNYLSVEGANSSITTLVREIRTARDGDNGAYSLELAEDNQIAFYSDYDFDGKTERLRYFLAGPQFSKGVTEPTGYPITYPSDQEKVKVITNLVRNQENPVFYYYNGDWPTDTENNPLLTPASLSDIKLIRLYLRLNTTPNEPEKDYVLESFSQVRMLKENL